MQEMTKKPAVLMALMLVMVLAPAGAASADCAACYPPPNASNTVAFEHAADQAQGPLHFNGWKRQGPE
jgi:hypothetical protein